MLNLIRRIFATPQGPSVFAATSTPKAYAIMRTIKEQGRFIVQERSVVIDHVEATSAEAATRIAHRNYGDSAYVVLVLND